MQFLLSPRKTAWLRPNENKNFKTIIVLDVTSFGLESRIYTRFVDQTIKFKIKTCFSFIAVLTSLDPG